jgi:hypothetical protein
VFVGKAGELSSSFLFNFRVNYYIKTHALCVHKPYKNYNPPGGQAFNRKNTFLNLISNLPK